jgi:hypothetical protein
MPTLKLTNCLTLTLPLCMAADAVLASVGTAQAQSSTASVVVDHQPTTLTRATTRLFAAGPTLFAVTPDGLCRSDDAGTTWRPQPLPPLPPNTTLSR